MNRNEPIRPLWDDPPPERPPLPSLDGDWHPAWDPQQVRSYDSEARLEQLAAAVGPLRRVLAAIAERLIGTEAHSQLCYARLGDYARERAGISARQLQELARVHRALETLPLLERALLENLLPWSKARLIARVATPQDEGLWIAKALAVSTRQLEAQVREHHRKAERDDPDEEEPQTRVTIQCTPAVREKWRVVRELAERVAGQRLRDADVLELVVAEVCSEVSIDRALAEALDAPPGPRRGGFPDLEPVAPPRAPQETLPPEVAALSRGLEDADAFELDRRLRLAVRLEQTLDAVMAPALRRVACAEYPWRKAYWPLARYAQEQLGMPASKARALIRLERAAEVCPELAEAYRSGRLSWVKARCLLPLLLLDLEGAWRPLWVAWAERVTVRRLEQDVERALLLRAGHLRAWLRCKFDPARAQDPIPESERSMCARDVDTEATEQLVFRVPQAVAGLLWAVHQTLRNRLWRAGRRPLRNGEMFELMLDAAVQAWTLREPGKRRPDPVIERDGYQCAIPGCTSRCNLQDHHVTYRSRGGGDAEHNRVTLCAFHHQRCVHMARMRVRGRAPDALVFELGLRGSAPPLASYRSGDIEIPPEEVHAHPVPRRAA